MTMVVRLCWLPYYEEEEETCDITHQLNIQLDPDHLHSPWDRRQPNNCLLIKVCETGRYRSWPGSLPNRDLLMAGAVVPCVPSRHQPTDGPTHGLMISMATPQGGTKAIITEWHKYHQYQSENLCQGNRVKEKLAQVSCLMKRQVSSQDKQWFMLWEGNRRTDCLTSKLEINSNANKIS